MGQHSHRPDSTTLAARQHDAIGLARRRRVAVALGAGTWLVGVALMVVFPREVHELPAGFRTPIIAFEFAQTTTEVRAMFTAADGRLDTRLLDAMDLGNAFDYGFLLLYGGFLTITAGFVAHSAGDRYRLASALAIIAAGSDAFENRQLLAITHALREGAGFDAQLSLLAQATWTKWGCLAIALSWLSPWLFRVSTAGKVAAAFAWVATLSGGAALWQRGALNEALSIAVTCAFIAIWLVLLRLRSELPAPGNTAYTLDNA